MNHDKSLKSVTITIVGYLKKEKKIVRKITNHQIKYVHLVLIRKSKKKEKSEQQKQKFIIASDIIDIEPLKNCVHKNLM